MRSVQREEEGVTPISVLTSYVRTLQQRRPAAENEGKEASSFRKALAISHINNPFFRKNQRIVGRERELQLLLDSYDRVVTTELTEAVTIHGPSGAGKSSLVEAFVGRLPAGAFYMEGKFNERQSRAPYAVLAAASDQLCRQIMRRENSAEIRNRIRAVLGPDVSLLGNLVPTLANMTAEDNTVTTGQQTIASNGAQMFTRFKLLFRAFLGCVASPETPVVFFLDDVQWADVASLEVLKTLLNNGQSQCIMVACAYREGEMVAAVLEQYCLLERGNTTSSVDDTTTTNSTGRLSCARITDISVDCLDSSSMNQLLSDTLGVDAAVTQSFSTLVWNKTNGNPFHALCFLDMLHRKSMLSSESDGSWTWDEDKILRGTDVAENLAEILASRIQDLPEQVRSILQIASFIGHDFLAATLVAIVYEEQDMLEAEYTFDRHSPEVIRERIDGALQIAVAVKLLETMPEAGHYKFAHDKVQEVLYEALMPDEIERQLLHRRIGSLIWDSVKEVTNSQIDDRFVFLAADHRNRAVCLVEIADERYDLIELNRIAAKRACGKAAFGAAAEYLQVAVSLLQGDSSSWDDQYELCIDVFTTAAETEKNRGMYSRSSTLVNLIHSRAKSLHDHSLAHAVEMDSLSLQGDSKGSIQVGLKAVRQLGVKFPRKTNLLAVAKELMRAKVALGRRSLSDLLYLPEMTDETSILALNLMNTIVVNCLIAGGAFKLTHAVVCIRMFRLTLKFGISPLYSPNAFFAWGSLHSVLGDFETSLQAERLSFDVVNKYEVHSLRASMVVWSYGMNHFWRSRLDLMAQNEILCACQMASSYGHVLVSHVGYCSWICAALFLDNSLTELNVILRRAVQDIREFQSKSILVILLPLWQLFLNMSGDARNLNPATLRGEAVGDQFMMELEDSDSTVAALIVSFAHLVLGFSYEDWDSVKINLPMIRKYRSDLDGHFTIGIILTFTAACHYEMYYMDRNSKHKRDGRRVHRKVKKWATTGADMLVGPNCFLRAMEILCVERAPSDQVEIAFEEAASACAAQRCRLLEALSNERLARLFRSEEPNCKCMKYLNRAIELYMSWGAVAKAEWLEEQYANGLSRRCE